MELYDQISPVFTVGPKLQVWDTAQLGPDNARSSQEQTRILSRRVVGATQLASTALPEYRATFVVISSSRAHRQCSAIRRVAMTWMWTSMRGCLGNTDKLWCSNGTNIKHEAGTISER